MTKENRIKEIIGAMQSFKKDAYHKEELLPEYLELQKELINLTFNDSHSENGKLRIWDVENHLEKLNEECGHIADEELNVFKEDSKFICNAIKSEFSGNAGEYKAFRSLETLRCKNKIMKNIGFKSGDHRTEIDAIVFTEKAVFIIEVKNPHRDIYIDERGNYCRVGDTMHLDCNIGEKMNDKVYLLREALKSAEYSNANIVSLVVFTNSTMHVDNRYDYITTCFLGNLPHIIERYNGKPIYSDSSISAMMESVSDAECKEAYPLEIDVNQYKYRFANLMATLEEANEKRSETIDAHEAETEEACQETVSEEVSEMPKLIKKPADKTRSSFVAAVGIAVAFGAGFIASQILGSNRK
ncbi:MAG: NERD domain-containing protein [Ruminococcus sp.]|nr:NERD domain-containing protein [Ruminococcus sp.]